MKSQSLHESLETIMINCSRSLTTSQQIVSQLTATCPATEALESLSWTPMREQRRRRVNSQWQKIQGPHFGNSESWVGSEVSKQRNEAFDMSALLSASQKVEGGMEFPSIRWTSEGDEEDKGTVSQRSSSYTNTFLGASDVIVPLPLRSSSTSSLGSKRRRSSKKSTSSNRLVRSIALDANLSSLVDSTRRIPADSGNAAFPSHYGQQRSSNTVASFKIDQYMKILKESEFLALTDHFSPKKQRNDGHFHNPQNPQE